MLLWRRFMHKRGKTSHHILTLITECVILTGRTVCMVNKTSYHEDVWGVEKDIHAFLTSAVHGGKWSPLTPWKTATLYPPDRTMGEAVSRSRRRRWKEKFHNSKLDLSAHRQPLYLQNYRGFNLKKKVPFHSTNGFSETERPFKLESLCTWLLSARSALNARI